MRTSRRMMVLAVVVIVGLCPAALSQSLTKVDEQTAISVARYYVFTAPPPAIAAAVEAGADLVLPPRPFPNVAEQVAWVFDLAVPGFAVSGPAVSGFVVTSAHFELEPLIAYSTESEFPWEPGPENALWNVLLMDLNNRLDALDAGQGRRDVDINIDLWNLGIAPLLGPIYACATCAAPDSSTYSGPDPIIGFPNDWHQGPPCNGKCYGNKTGCVALAMAQIIYHHKFPASATVDHYPVSFDYRDSPTCANLEVQKLCHATGVSADTNYGRIASSANIERAAMALRTTWQYERDMASATYRTGLVIASNSYQPLRDDMLAGRPAILNLKGQHLGLTTQHAVVCDGYKVEHQAGTELSLAFHLRMGNNDEGVNVWYSLPSDCFPPTYHALIEGVLHIPRPGEIPPGACNLTLNINEDDNHYDLWQWVRVKVNANRDAAAVLYAFSALIPDLWTSVTWNIEAGQDVPFPVPWPALNSGVETVVLWADMGGGCTRVLPRTYVIGPDLSLLDALQVDGSYSPSSKTVSVSYLITPSNYEVSSVTAYLISPDRGAERIRSSPGRTGSFQNISLQGSGTGEHIVVIVASTSAGALSRTYSFFVK